MLVNLRGVEFQARKVALGSVFVLPSLTVEQRASKKSTPISIKVASEKNYA